MITRLRLRLMALMTILVLPMAAMTITASPAAASGRGYSPHVQSQPAGYHQQDATRGRQEGARQQNFFERRPSSPPHKNCNKPITKPPVVTPPVPEKPVGSG